MDGDGSAPDWSKKEALLLAAVLGAEELLAGVGGRLDGPTPLLPVRGTHLSVLLGELQRLHHTEGLVDAAPERQVVHDLMAHDAFGIDQEETAERDAIRQQDVVRARDVLLEVGDQRIRDVAE